MEPRWGILIQSYYFIDYYIKLATGLAHSCWDTILLFIDYYIKLATGLALSCWSENRVTIN